MLRSITIVSTGTLASRLTGFVRDAMLAALLGTGAIADAFLVAFQLVTVIRRLLTEGALNAAFVPRWLHIRETQGDGAAMAFAGRAIGTIGMIVVIVALIVALAAPWAIVLLAPGFAGLETMNLAVVNARLMLPYLGFAGAVAVLMALANAQRRVAFSSATPVLFNLLLIVAVALLMIRGTQASDAAWMIAATVGVAGLLQLTMLASATGKAVPPRFGIDAEMRALLARALPGMIAGAGSQMLIVAGAIAASHIPSGISWLYFASRLIDLPLGIVSTISGAVFVTEASHAARDDEAAQKAQAHAVGIAIGLALPAAIGLVMLADPIVRLVFGRGAFTEADAAATASALQMLALGLPAQALARALAPSFYARGDTMTPMIAALVGLVAGLIAALISSSIAGIAAAIALGSAVSAAILLARSGRFHRSDARLIPVAAASVAMAAAISALLFAVETTGSSAFALAGKTAMLITGGLAIYLSALFLFGALRLSEIRTAWRQRGLREGDARGRGTATARAQDVSK